MLMKRMLLLAVLAGIAAGTAGCKRQDAPKLDRQAVRLYVGDQVRITADRSVAWSVADDFYAAVDGEGTVTARHVGTTTVTAAADSGSAACTVEVQPRYDTFEEPPIQLLWQPMEAIESLESGKIIKTEQPNDKLKVVWVEEDNLQLKSRAYYCFRYGEDFLVQIICLEAYKKDMEDIIDFYEERYETIHEYPDPLCYRHPGNTLFPHTYTVIFTEFGEEPQDTFAIFYEGYISDK